MSCDVSSNKIIFANNLHKQFPIYEKPWHRLMQMLWPCNRQRWFRRFHALKGASFDIFRGEVVGVVGRNGSGKSTLLQILCGTLRPSSGQLQVSGRISALLELGSGFNPEFTGRENVFLNGAILGLSREEVEERYEAIAAFADIGEFIDRPLKTYSSGMYVRLAFAVAINVDPDILVIDEALAVGDELFQRKCFSRLEQLRSQGVTILFVSHSASAVIELCDRAILLDSGELLADGDPKEVVALYQKLLYAPTEDVAVVREGILKQRFIGSVDANFAKDSEVLSIEKNEPLEEDELETFDPQFVPTNTVVFASHGAIISNPHIRTLDGRIVNGLVRGREYRYCYTVSFDRVLTGVRFGMLIKTVSGLHLGGSLSQANIHDGMVTVRGQVVNVEFTFKCLLNPAVYFLNAGVFGCADEGETLLHRLADAAVFRVLPVSHNRAQEIVDFDCRVEVNCNV